MIELRNITKKFNLSGNQKDLKIALNNVSLTINDGEFVAIIGGNGSGKTTTFNILSGALTPDDGSVLIDGNDVTKMNEHKRAKFIGRVFQDPMVGTCGDMSILENLEIAFRRGKSHRLVWGFKKENKTLFINELKRFNLDLENRLNQKAKLLSGGQRQALTLLMATLQKPSLLLLDEHTAALDPETSKTVMTLTNEIVRQEKLTTLMITHHLGDALKYADRIIMFNKGQVVLDISGKTKENMTQLELYKLFGEITNK